MTSSESTAVEVYDQNFCYPLPPKLENEKVRLEPFIPSKHAKLLFEAIHRYPEVYNYLPLGPFTSVQDWLENWYEPVIHKVPGNVLFILFDKKTSLSPEQPEDHKGAIAGHFAYINTFPENLKTEIGWIIVLPPFQRTHVSTNAVGLMMHVALDLPEGRGGYGLGWGLRRVQWQTNSHNKASRRLAERFGYRFEGIIRWDRVLPESKREFGNNRPLRTGDEKVECIGRHTAIYSHCWDDWENGGRDKIMDLTIREK